MPLRGCVRVHCLPLQVLLEDNPSWKGTPVAVTREEKPQSPIVALNGEARDKGLTEGMRYASALSLVPGLRARGVPAERIGKARERIAKLLSRYTPDVEPCPFDQGAFWVSLEGLRSLFGTEERWRSQVSSALELQGFPSAIVSGFTRFGTYVLACAGTGTRGFATRGFATRDQEWDSLQRSSVNLLPLPHRIRGILRKLEIRTVGQFVRLPAGEMLRRLGTEAGELRAAILSDDPLPIQPLEMKEPVAASRRLDAPRSDTALLLPHIEELVSAEAERAEAQRSVISALVLSLRTEDGEASTDLIRPAAPTRSTSVLMRLIRLRLSERRFASGVERIEVRCAHARPSRAQEELFTSRGRDLASGARAFALVRARFGESSVSCARLRSSHLPEDSFQWVPMERPVLPSRPVPQNGPVPPNPVLPASPPRGSEPDARSPAVRRILFSASPLPGGPRRVRRDGFQDLLVSVRWWGETAEDAAVRRAYWFQETRDRVAWVYEDGLTAATWLQGVVD